MNQEKIWSLNTMSELTEFDKKRITASFRGMCEVAKQKPRETLEYIDDLCTNHSAIYSKEEAAMNLLGLVKGVLFCSLYDPSKVISVLHNIVPEQMHDLVPGDFIGPKRK